MYYIEGIKKYYMIYWGDRSMLHSIMEDWKILYVLCIVGETRSLNIIYQYH